MKGILIALFIGIVAIGVAQPTQMIRGKVVDSETQAPLVGVRVEIINDSTGSFISATDLDGRFKLEGVPVGRHTLMFQLITYRTHQQDINLTSGKEFIVNVYLEESAEEMDELVVTTDNPRGEAANEMAMISARRFSVEETERYAGSRGDPARMASNYAGVQGADDSRNDIVVRGNSPMGVLYRVEGIDIPNPNHFSIAGSQGGPVTILNNKVLANSDFFTGAFPAEFGNSIAAVFDINLRNGNNEKFEFSGQLGFLGTEITAEGPLGKDSRSSFLFNYRYSTLVLFNSLGIDIGTDAVPQYQDAAFKLSIPTKNNAHWSVFGIGGKSEIDIKISDQLAPPDEPDLYGENDRDQYFATSMGILGTKYSKTLNDKTFFTFTLAGTYQQQVSVHHYVDRHIDSSSGSPVFVNDSIYKVQDYVFREPRITIGTSFTTKVNRRNILKYGLNADYHFFEYRDSGLDFSHTYWFSRWDTAGGTSLVQPYVQWKYKASEDLTFTSGLHLTYSQLGNDLSPVEPRIGLKYKVGNRQALSFGAGLHTQRQPFYTYFYHLNDTAGNKIYHNLDMEMTRSIHLISGYQIGFKNNMRIKSEVYYQYLYNVPVEIRPSAFSLVNQGSGFARFFPDTLVNEGTAQNYGIELTLEKFFDNDFFFLVTGSVYNSTYEGSDGVTRNTDYNGQYVLNALAGKEWKIKEKNQLNLGTKITLAGGKRYGIVDTTASQAQSELIFQDDGYNESQFRDYFRLDFKINYIINAKKVSHEIALDLLNITGAQNILGLTYTPNQPDGRDFRENYQLGFLPLFYYKLQF